MSERETWEVLTTHGPDGRARFDIKRTGYGWVTGDIHDAALSRRIAKLPELERRVEELERLLRESEAQNDVLMQLMWGTHAS